MSPRVRPPYLAALASALLIAGIVVAQGLGAGGLKTGGVVSGRTITPAIVKANDGTAAAPSHTFSSSGNDDNGMFLSAANALGFSTAGTERITLDSAGKFLLVPSSMEGSATSSTFLITSNTNDATADATTTGALTLQSLAALTGGDISLIVKRSDGTKLASFHTDAMLSTGFVDATTEASGYKLDGQSTLFYESTVTSTMRLRSNGTPEATVGAIRLHAAAAGAANTLLLNLIDSGSVDRWSVDAEGDMIIGGTLKFNSGAVISKHLSATASLDFTALAANSCEVLTIAATGAADGDTVVLGVPTALADVDGATERTLFYGWVSAADTVSVRRCNVTGTITADPAAATVRVDAWKH